MFLSNEKARALADEQIARLRIKTASRDSAVRTLSGGNQQKVVLAKWLATEPDILVLDEPTAGIDIGSKSEIIPLVRELASGGQGDRHDLVGAVRDAVGLRPHPVMSDGRIMRRHRPRRSRRRGGRWR